VNGLKIKATNLVEKTCGAAGSCAALQAQSAKAFDDNKVQSEIHGSTL
jgi:hypothetical protein